MNAPIPIFVACGRCGVLNNTSARWCPECDGTNAAMTLAAQALERCGLRVESSVLRRVRDAKLRLELLRADEARLGVCCRYAHATEQSDAHAREALSTVRHAIRLLEARCR